MNDPLRVDHEQRSLAHPVVFAVHAVSAGHRALWMAVGEQREMQLAVPGKGGVAPRAVNRDAEELSPQFLELRKDFVVERHLVPTNRAPVSRVKREHHRLAAEVAQADELVRCAPQSEIGSHGAGRQRG